MLTFNQLAQTLAELNSCSVADAENFLRELFTLAAEELESEGGVEVPAIGCFALMDGEVIYQPDAELAAALNAPFADFEPVELPAGFSLDAPEEPAEPSEQSEESESLEQSEESEESEESEPSEVSEVSETSAAPVPAAPRKGIGCCWAMLLGLIALIVGFVAGWFVREKYNPTPVNEPVAVEETEVIEVVKIVPDTAEVAADEPMEAVPDEPAPQTLDTVRPGYFLTTMSRRHYGQKDYWVYIYEANSDKLGNPDYVEVGTVVVIPSADSLGLVPDNAEKIAEAKRKATEIYNRFN